MTMQMLISHRTQKTLQSLCINELHILFLFVPKRHSIQLLYKWASYQLWYWRSQRLYHWWELCRFWCPFHKCIFEVRGCTYGPQATDSLVGQPDEYDNLCGIPNSASAVTDFQALPMFETTDEIVADVDDDNCGEESKSQPTGYGYDPDVKCVYGFPEYNNIVGAIPQNLVTAQVSSLCISCVSNYHKP